MITDRFIPVIGAGAAAYIAFKEGIDHPERAVPGILFFGSILLVLFIFGRNRK